MADRASAKTNAACLPGEGGSSWDEFAQEWCLGGGLRSSQEEVVRALDAVTRLWPEEAAKLVAQPCRGLGIAAGAVELGRLLADCEQLNGFGPVLDRLKGVSGNRIL